MLEDSEGHKPIYINREMVVKKQEKEAMAKAIRRAMREDRVEMFFQPIYSVKEKQFVSAEALVRIRNTDGSILSPGMFIPVAEETGSILRLGEIVFEKTSQFIMEKYHMDPSLINLEITETGSIKARKVLLRNMEKLMSYGVQFSLDDFGNGESNLNYNVDMPVEIIKFDRDMTQAYFNKDKAKFVMQEAKNMIHEMGLQIVAEGVETEEQAKGECWVEDGKAKERANVWNGLSGWRRSGGSGACDGKRYGSDKKSRLYYL